VPKTISDRQMADLQRRAQRAAPPLFSPKTVAARKASEDQRRKSKWS